MKQLFLRWQQLSGLLPPQGSGRESAATVKPDWYIVWGVSSLPLVTGVTWQDEQIAIALTEPTFSPQQQFVVVGDIWLSNRDRLISYLGINPEVAVSDCQLVAQLWEKSGVGGLDLLEGMWAIAIWDRDRRELSLIRDRVGCRTLYYIHRGETGWIAPRIRTLAPYRTGELDLVALRDYLCCAFVPGERTLWQDVRELAPGKIWRFPEHPPQSYWQVKEDIRHPEQPLIWHGEKLRSQLEAVVQEYLPQDQPVGVFLSGGIDSSSITALAAKLHRHPVHTYSIHFGLEYPHELDFANLVAAHCHTEHHILEVSLQQLWELLPEAIAHLDDPIGEGLTVPNLLVGKLAKELVGVTLNGEGGDPCFGGPKNQAMLLNSIYSRVQEQVDPVAAYLTSFKKCFPDLPRLLKPEIWEAVREQPYFFAADLTAAESTYLNRLMAVNIKFKGADYILTKVSNFTQAAGLQGRSPLFDRRIVELSMQIPPEYKLAGVTEKAVLKQAVADLLPEAILNRPKSGMVMHLQQWFRTIWRQKAQDLLLNQKAAIAPYLNQAVIKEWLEYRGQLWSRYGVLLWLLVTLEIWLQENQKPSKF